MSSYGSGVVVGHPERAIFGSIVREVALGGGGTVCTRFFEQVRKQLKVDQNEIVDLAAIRDAVRRTADTGPAIDSEMLQTIHRRLRALEESVGPDAPCVRNIASPKTRQGCVHRIDQAKVHYTVCGWQYNLAAHVRLALEDGGGLPKS